MECIEVVSVCIGSVFRANHPSVKHGVRSGIPISELNR